MPLAAIAVQQLLDQAADVAGQEWLFPGAAAWRRPSSVSSVVALVAVLVVALAAVPDDGVDNPARVSAGLRCMVVSSFPSGAPIARGRFPNGAMFRGDCAGRGKWFRSGANCFAARRIVSR